MPMTAARCVMVWRVPQAGYCWQEAYIIHDQRQVHETGKRLLVPQSAAFYEYNPLDVPDLFRSFAALASPDAVPTPGYTLDEVPDWEERIRQFANRYGALGVSSLVRLPNPQVAHVNSHTVGELLTTWHDESYRMRIALEVWDALQADDTATLQRWFLISQGKDFSAGTFRPDDPWTVEPPIALLSDEVAALQGVLMLDKTDPTDHWEEWPSSPVQWALIHLREWVNRQLGMHTSPRLQRVLSSPEKIPLQLAIIPKNLLGGMWLQFARVIEGELRYEQCAECGTWFRVKPRGNRPDTRFCKTLCRVKANRRAHPQRPKKKAAAR
jgi:hypothetical protein